MEKVNSVIVIGLFLATAVTGVIGRDHHVFNWLYDRIMLPLGVTFVSMNMFYLVTAAFRAFRAQSLESLLAAGSRYHRSAG